MIAVGYKAGNIELYYVSCDNNVQLTQRFKCHKEPVNFLLFSPATEENDIEKTSILGENPIILASISEEICFWNVTHAINNPIERGNELRLSQRINRKPNPDRANIQVTHINKEITGGSLAKLKTADACSHRILVNCKKSCEVYNPWIGKTGTSEKPELLSCIKLVGNSAEKLYANRTFNTFITVDNEGVIYFLKAKSQLNEI